jgi:antagonist of KipI
MHQLTLTFLKSGLHTLIQDEGRSGHQASGIPIGGVMDKKAAHAANWCVGNPSNTPVLEITLTGPKIHFSADCQIAITGANMEVTLNDKKISTYETINVVAESELSFRKLKSGCRAYLAIRGKWLIQKWLGSASALSIGDHDLVPGTVMDKGSKLTVRVNKPLKEILKHSDPVTDWPEEKEIRVYAGPELQSFSAQQIAFFFHNPFTIAKESNRMGYRLDPSLPDYKQEEEFISSGVIPGTIQITRVGYPIVLLADAQTTGGYPRIAMVTSEDIDAFAQLKQGDTVKFQIVTLKPVRMTE